MSRQASLPTPTAGSHRSRRSHRFLLALLALIALLGSACSNTTETNTAGNRDVVVRTPPTESDKSADAGSSIVDDSTATNDPVKEGPSDAIVKLPAKNEPTPIVKDPAAVAVPSSGVLAAALSQTDENSFSFDMGMNMNMNMMGMSMVMAPEEPLMTGSVSGDRMHAVMDMSVMMQGTTVTDEQGIPVPMGPMDEFDDLQLEMWFDGTVMTIDMSTMAALDPAVTGAAARGPVSFDLNELGDSFGVDEVTSEMLGDAGMFSGMGSMDPAEIGNILRGLDSVVEAGRAEVDGRAVTVYSGSVSMADYTEAMGEDIWSELGQMDDMGSPEELAAMVSAIESLDIEMTVMVDDDDLLRRFEMFIDMGPMFEAMLGGAQTFEPGAEALTDEDEFGQALEEAFAAMFADLDMTMFTWMEFYDYGESFVFSPPAAVDLTDDADVLFGDSIAA